uniref:Uncharacterized protein LOC111099998 isoform X2 n=1 Tax=Crassostrea virginica TaxID=6565 RepID=A0A8B8ABH9_CRAVI|nr:uncharacterized protein LOC111099998 isoform X2 [Crassostrea virginica]
MLRVTLIDGDPVSFSCPVSRDTVQPVHNCPENEEDWREAAERKNCSQHANQCDDPDRLVYHCVINPFVNETLEVCAYPQNIVFGICAEYNRQWNVIQGNYQTNCTRFWTKPCPVVYRSNSSFKYPGCYELVKKRRPKPDSTTITLNTQKYMSITEHQKTRTTNRLFLSRYCPCDISGM